jgi:hypothetical protein
MFFVSYSPFNREEVNSSVSKVKRKKEQRNIDLKTILGFLTALIWLVIEILEKI